MLSATMLSVMSLTIQKIKHFSFFKSSFLKLKLLQITLRNAFLTCLHNMSSWHDFFKNFHLFQSCLFQTTLKFKRCHNNHSFKSNSLSSPLIFIFLTKNKLKSKRNNKFTSCFNESSPPYKVSPTTTTRNNVFFFHFSF